jgi:hypothetical protein
VNRESSIDGNPIRTPVAFSGYDNANINESDMQKRNDWVVEETKRVKNLTVLHSRLTIHEQLLHFLKVNIVVVL